MFKKLTNKQVRDHWEDLKHAIIADFPTHPKNVNLWLNSILEGILKGDLGYWVGLDENRNIVLACLTSFIQDPCTFEKSLMISSVYGYLQIPEEVWLDGIKSILLYAQDSGCAAVVAYSENKEVIELGQKTNANVATTYIQWRL